MFTKVTVVITSWLYKSDHYARCFTLIQCCMSVISQKKKTGRKKTVSNKKRKEINQVKNGKTASHIKVFVP